MLRSIGSVTFLALFMVGCGGGDSSSPPPPPPPTYTVGGSVTGLTGSGLVLQTNAGDVASVSKAGAFTFRNALGSGAAYTVTVKTQASAPAQNCVVTNGSGTVGTDNVTTVAVACSTAATYTVGGTVTGLTGSGLVLQTNAGDVASVSKAGAFTFRNALGSGAAYTVTVKTQPSAPAQNCVVTNGSGTVGTANVTTVAVACSTAATYTVGGTVSGLVGSGLTLAICAAVSHQGHKPPPPPVCRSELQIGVNGAFILDSAYLAGYSGSDYVAITQQPSSPTQNCLISNAAISIQSANDTSVTVSCAEYSYVTNAADNTLSSYSIDPTTGALAVVGTPIATGASPNAIVGVDYGEGKSFVYVGNAGSNDISAFAVDSTTGALTATPGSPFAAGIAPQAMSLYGGFLYVANAGSDNVSVYTIDARNTGALAPLSPGPSTIATGKSPTSIVLGGPSIIYVANHGGSNDISAFSLDTNTGVMTPIAGSPFPAGGNPLSLALAAGDTLLYTANPDATNPSISGFRIDQATGALSPLSGSPFPVPVSHYMATDAFGSYLYVTSGAGILGYAIDWTTGALTALPGFPVTAGANAYSVNIHFAKPGSNSIDQILYVANEGAANVSGFTLNASTGALTPMAGSPFPAGNHPEFVATF